MPSDLNDGVQVIFAVPLRLVHVRQTLLKVLGGFVHRCRQTERQADRRKDRPTEGQTDRQTQRKTNRRKDKRDEHES